MWDDSEWGRRPPRFEAGSRRWGSDREDAPKSTVGGAIAGFVMMIVIMAIMAAAGFPGSFIFLAFLLAIVALAGGLAASNAEERRIREAEAAEAEARDRLVEDITMSVKTSLEGRIKVRCRYCGGLNEEHDERCESCGAPL